MVIHDNVKVQEFRCPRCGNSDFPDGIRRPAFICPVIGCNFVIEPDNMPPMLPDPVSVIGEDAFADCAELESIVFGSGLTLLDRGCLRGCASLYEVTLPEKLREIGREAFADCSQLEAVSIGSGVQIIRDNAFLMCASLSRFTFGKRPPHIAVTAFSGCYSFDEAALFPDGQ